MSFEIIKPGMYTTIQDAGRFGHRQHGVVTSGAMDPWSLRVANRLLQNGLCELAIEMMLVGPSVLFEQDSLIAIYGGEWNVTLDGHSIQCGRPYEIRAGQLLEVRDAQSGTWGYLAVDGLDVPSVLGSYSTHVRSRLGGFEGRCLAKGDRISLRSRASDRVQKSSTSDGWYVPWIAPFKGNGRTNSMAGALKVRFIPGSHWDRLDEPSRSQFVSCNAIISRKSDRMGYRFEYDHDSTQINVTNQSDKNKLRFSQEIQMVSEPNAVGTIQLPPSGDPILLMADAATTGGYPRIGHVIETDLAIIAQCRPGTAIQFEMVSIETSHHLIRQRQRDWHRLNYGIATHQIQD